MNEYRERDIEQRQCFHTSPIHLLTHHHNNLTKKAGGRRELTFFSQDPAQTWKANPSLWESSYLPWHHLQSLKTS